MHAQTCKQTLRNEWVLKWSGQVVIAECQTYWTSEVSQALEEGTLPALFQKMLGQVCVCVCVCVCVGVCVCVHVH